MKKFFRFGKDKKNKGGESSEGKGSSKSLSGSVGEQELKSGYNVRDKDLGKLHKAAWHGDLHKVKQLAKKDASPLDKERRTPLHLACVKGHHLIVQELLEWKAKINAEDNEGKTPLMKAVECDQDECVRILLEERATNPNARDRSGLSSLHIAAQNGLEEILGLLLSQDATEVNIKDKHHNTPLHIAVMCGDLNSCNILLDEGADPDQQDYEGKTPLMIASFSGFTEIVESLLHYNANTELQEKNGWTADDIATMQSQENCLRLLRRSGGARVSGGDPMAMTAEDIDDDEEEEEEEEEDEEGDGEEEGAVGGLDPGDSWGDSDPEDMSEEDLRRKVEERQQLDDLKAKFQIFQKKKQVEQ